MAPPAWAELPPPLGAGGATTVAIVAPCGPCVRGALPAALAALAREPFGWRVRTSVQAGARHKGEAPPAGEAAYLAGSDTDRLHALLEAYKDPSVGAIVVAKGTLSPPLTLLTCACSHKAACMDCLTRAWRTV